MVTTVTNTLNALFASSFSDVRRTNAALDQRQIDVNALNRVTAQTPVEQPSDSTSNLTRRQQQQSLLRFLDERQPRLNDFVRPRADLNPADEVALFSLPPEVASSASTLSGSTLTNLDREEIITRAQQNAANDAAALRRQSYVANLYAQTGDITFSSDRVLNQAA